MIFIILGPPGCGKGTQAQLIARKYNLAHISTGQLLRKSYEEKTALGLKAYEWWGKGTWAPTEVVELILKEELKKYPAGNFILEGWPRFSEQTEILGNYLSEKGLKLDRAFYLDTPREDSLSRMKARVKRMIASGMTPRVDDKEPLMQERLATYYRTVGPILEYYRHLGILEVVNNRSSIEVVFRQIEQKIDDYLQKR